MKTKHAFSMLLASALLSAAAVTTHAQTWDTYLPQPDTSAYGNHVLIDPFSADPSNPAVFVGYNSSTYGNGCLLRMEPTSASDYNVTVVDNGNTTVTQLGFDSTSSTLYGVGHRPGVISPPFPSSNPDVWSVRKSSAGGAPNSWTDADVFPLSSKASSAARSIAVDAAGNVYVCGTATPAKGSAHWIVRKLPRGGSWTTVCDISSNQGDASAEGIYFYPGNGAYPPAILAVGIVGLKWTVLRSQNQGASWQTVDSWSYARNAYATAMDVASDSVGNIFAVGRRTVTTGLSIAMGWIVRASANGGNTWNTVLDVAEGPNSWAYSVAADANGNVWVSGMTEDAAGTPRWTVLKNGVFGSLSANNAAFLQTRELPLGGGTSSWAHGVATDDAGSHVFVTGRVMDWVDNSTMPATSYPGSRLVVQRLLP